MKEKIISRNNQKVVYANSLKSNKKMKEHKEFLMEGRKNLEMALAYNMVKEIFSIKEIDNVSKKIPLYIVTEEIIDKLSNSKNPEGIVFICYMKDEIKPKNNESVLYLECIQDPGNMGNILRTALCFGFNNVVLSYDSVNLYNEKVIASSKGSIFALNICHDDICNIKEDRTVVVSALTKEAKIFDEINIKSPIVLVLGNEGKGVKESTLKLADYIVKIPINGIDSLNVSSAASILMYEYSKIR